VKRSRNFGTSGFSQLLTVAEYESAVAQRKAEAKAQKDTKDKAAKEAKEAKQLEKKEERERKAEAKAEAKAAVRAAKAAKAAKAAAKAKAKAKSKPKAKSGLRKRQREDGDVSGSDAERPAKRVKVEGDAADDADGEGSAARPARRARPRGSLAVHSEEEPVRRRCLLLSLLQLPRMTPRPAQRTARASGFCFWRWIV
jgi:hypothetical protein